MIDSDLKRDLWGLEVNPAYKKRSKKSSAEKVMREKLGLRRVGMVILKYLRAVKYTNDSGV